MPVLGKKSLTVAEELHHQAATAARARRVTIEQFVTDAVLAHLAAKPEYPGVQEVGQKYKLPPHRQELVEKFLAWWDGDKSEIGLAVKAAVAKLAGVPWIQPEIDAQQQKAKRK